MSHESHPSEESPFFVGAASSDLPPFIESLEREFPDIPRHKIYEAYETARQTTGSSAAASGALDIRIHELLKTAGST